MNKKHPVYFFLNKYKRTTKVKKLHVVYRDPFGKKRWTHEIMGAVASKTRLAYFFYRGVYAYKTKLLVTKQWVRENLKDITPSNWEMR